MPQQLIYTSAPRGIVPGRSGHCTVARSASMREALMLQLEKFSYYQHLSLSGGQERPIFSCRHVDIRGTRFHVLSRIQDAGLDFTGRTNFIAQHLVFTPEEIRQCPTPPVILHHWPGWIKSWAKEPQLLENEDWSGLTALAGRTNIPAQTWQQVTGDAVNGYGLLEARAGASFRVDEHADETVLELLAESLELLEVRDPRRDFRVAAWNHTFTTSLQEQDNPADFRWRCLHSDHPAASRLATPDCRALSAVRATKLTEEEIAFARTGRQAPRFVEQPSDVRITEGEPAHLSAKAEGIPSAAYQWFSVDRANNGQILSGEVRPELTISNPLLGVSRYIVSAVNTAGNVQSRMVTLSVERKLKLEATVAARSRTETKPALYHIKSAEEIEEQRQRIEIENALGMSQRKLWRNKTLAVAGTVIVIFVFVLAVAFHKGWLSFGDKRISTVNSSANQSNLPVQPSGTSNTNQSHPPDTNASDKSSNALATTSQMAAATTEPKASEKPPMQDKLAASDMAKASNPQRTNGPAKK